MPATLMSYRAAMEKVLNDALGRPERLFKVGELQWVQDTDKFEATVEISGRMIDEKEKT